MMIDDVGNLLMCNVLYSKRIEWTKEYSEKLRLFRSSSYMGNRRRKSLSLDSCIAIDRRDRLEKAPHLIHEMD